MFMGLGIISLNPLLYLGIAFGILALIAILLYYLKLDQIFICTFTLLSGMYISASVWEALIINIIPGTAPIYLFSMWWITFGFAAASFPITYTIYQKQTQQTILWRKTLSLGALVAGIVLFMGVLQDFGCFIIWGLEHFNPLEAYWHVWMGNLMPWWYLAAIPGGFLILLGLYSGRITGPNTTRSEAPSPLR
jgi:hypothetical protein